jgi:hypothetical protein
MVDVSEGAMTLSDGNANQHFVLGSCRTENSVWREEIEGSAAEFLRGRMVGTKDLRGLRIT